MADNNRNWNNQYQQSNDWEQNRNRFEDEDRDRQNYRYGNTSGSDYNQTNGMRNNYGKQYGDSTKGSEMENQAGYGGAYSSDYDYQGGNSGQSNWDNQGSRQNWQGSGNNQSQQWRDNNWKRRSEGYGYGQQDWQRRNIENNYDAGRHRSFGNEYGNMSDYDERYNTGYGEGRGMTSGYSNRNYGNRDRWQGNYGNDQYDRNRDWWDRTKDEVSSWFGDDDAEHRRRVDKINGPHKGKGPRDYRRSEDRIREDVCDRLADDDYVDASNINVQIQNDEVVLSGTVNSREEKRRAEDVVESISGVRNVENRLRVGTSDTNFERYTGTTSDAGGVGRESGTTNEVIRNEKNKNR